MKSVGERSEAMESSAPTQRTPLLRRSPSSPPDDSRDRDALDAMHGGWWSELWLLIRFAIPLIATYLLQYSWLIIVTTIAGHLSADDLAAASVAMTTMTIVGFTAYEGMATALDTLCSQAYGAGNLAGVGLHVQRMIAFMALLAVPIGVFWMASPSILSLLLKQNHLAIMAGTFLRVSILGMPGYGFFEAGKRFLQAQGSFRPAMVILIICAPINALLSWWFAFRLEMGIAGAALGVAVANNLRPLLLLLYILSPAGRWSHKCWGGFSCAALSVRKWGPMARLSFAGTAVNLGEWGAFQAVAFSTSYISTNHLATQTLLTTISVVSWHIPFSVSVGISTRIGHLIGAGELETARRAAKLYACIFLAIGSFDGLVIFLLRNSLPQLFSDDPAVCALASQTLLAVSLFQVIDAFICFTNGMLRGLGRQAVAAWLVTAVNYLAAVPFAIWLELGPANLGLYGVWIGMASGMVVIAAVECLYMKAFRWQRCVNKVKMRNSM